MKKRFLLTILSLFILNMCSASLLAQTVYVRKGNKPDASSSGTEAYKIEPTEEQQKARKEAAIEYSSSVASQSINIKPYFEDWTTKEAQAKVNNIGTKLLLANDINDFVRFSVSRKEAVNATTNYNNVINVYKGLLEYVETEDELAYVIGHELGHVYKNDVRTAVIRRGVAIGTILAGAIVAGTSGTSAGRNTGGGLILAGTGGGLVDRKLTKGQERRADLSGIDFMVKAGYNPLAAISMMNKILNRRWDILSDHPSGDKRIIYAYDYIAQKYPKYLDGGYDTISYQRALNYIKQKKNEISVKQKNNKNLKSRNNSKKEYKQKTDNI